MKELVIRSGDDYLTSWCVLGQHTCRRAWQTLHCMGSFHSYLASALMHGLAMGNVVSFKILQTYFRASALMSHLNV